MNRRKSLRVAGLLAIAAVLLTLPAVASEYKEEFHKTFPVEANAQISLSNVNGSVEVSGWDRNEVQVDATKYADTQQKLDRMKIEVNASSGSVSIQTRYPERTNNDPGRVEYKIHVPRTARLDKIETVNGGVQISNISNSVAASSVNGHVTGTALAGNIDLSAVNGGVSCEALNLANARTVKLHSVNGGVEFFMPRESNTHLTASTVHGGIQSDFNLPVSRNFVGSTLDTTLGSGATQVDLSSVNGGISIRGGSKGI